MTETDWLECTDPSPMALFLGKYLSKRELRLFGCACVRRVWRDLPEEGLRQAIETCERFADDLATSQELESARELAHSSYQGIGDIIIDHSAIVVTALCEPHPWFPMGAGSSAGIAAVEAEARFGGEISWGAAHDQAKQAHSDLLREIIGNPFRPRPPRKGKRVWKEQFESWRRWKQGTLPALARTVYEHRFLPDGTLDGVRLSILADALADAGCIDPAILDHCRSPEPHVRACWVVDLLLDKS